MSAKFETETGLLLQRIKDAKLEPAKRHFLVLYNYLHLSSQVAPVLNEFMQTGYSEEIKNLITFEISAG